MKRKSCYGGDVLRDLLKSVGLQNMASDSDEDDGDSSESEHNVNWVHQVISGYYTRAVNHDSAEVVEKNA